MNSGNFGERHMNDLDVAAYIDRGLEPRRLTEVEEHLAYCEECRENLVKAQELVTRSRAPRSYVRPIAVLAAAAAVILVAIPSLKRTADTRDSMRASGDASPLLIYGPVGETRTIPVRFTWGAVPGALSYHLTVTTESGATVWSVSSSDTMMVAPQTVPLAPGNRYLWSVDAITADGTTRSTGTHEFGIVP
jgi:anti-sigma factor RsiW